MARVGKEEADYIGGILGPVQRAVWTGLWRVAQRVALVPAASFALDRANHIVYAQYVVDQLGEPDYLVALQAVRQAVLA